MLLLVTSAVSLLAPARPAARRPHPPPRAGVLTADLPVIDEASPKTSFANDFAWKRNWYPLAFAKATDKALPHRLELFGEPLVLWWDHNAEAWATMSDACPHRLAPLSEARAALSPTAQSPLVTLCSSHATDGGEWLLVTCHLRVAPTPLSRHSQGRIDENGQIECPYHGWTFTAEGACTKIPQAEDTAEPRLLARCGGVAYATVEKQGVVWAWGEPLDFSGGSSAAALPNEGLVPTCEAMDDERFVWIDVSRDMPYSADMLLENVLDSSHVPFTHHHTISKRCARER